MRSLLIYTKDPVCHLSFNQMGFSSENLGGICIRYWNDNKIPSSIPAKSWRALCWFLVRTLRSSTTVILGLVTSRYLNNLIVGLYSVYSSHVRITSGGTSRLLAKFCQFLILLNFRSKHLENSSSAVVKSWKPLTSYVFGPGGKWWPDLYLQKDLSLIFYTALAILAANQQQ